MRKILVIATSLVLLSSTAFAKGSRGSVGSSGTGSNGSSARVHGYTKKNGKQVQSYRRTTPDGTQKNNYSTKGNTNTATGKKGTRNAKK